MFGKRKIHISDILIYGRYYSLLEYEIIDPIYWFKLSDYKIYDGEKLIENGMFEDASHLKKSEQFIPLFKTDITKVEKDFVEQFCPNEKSVIDDIERANPSYNYDIAFREFIETHPLLENWFEFEYERLEHDAVRWCMVNGIRYSLK